MERINENVPETKIKLPQPNLELKLSGLTEEGDFVFVKNPDPAKTDYWIEVVLIDGDEDWNKKFIGQPVESFKAVAKKP